MSKKNKVKKPIYKKWWFWVIVVIFVLGMIGSIGGTSDSESSSDKNEVVSESDSIKVETTEETKVEESKTEENVSNENSENDSKEELKNALKDKEGLVWFGDVRNDVTGNWRLSEYASSDTLETFAAEYYNAFFESDDEIHAVINMSTKVTGKITKVMDDTLDVTLYEYVKGEEHDAKELYGGMLLKEYWVTISTGEIEEIQ